MDSFNQGSQSDNKSFTNTPSTGSDDHSSSVYTTNSNNDVASLSQQNKSDTDQESPSISVTDEHQTVAKTDVASPPNNIPTDVIVPPHTPVKYGGKKIIATIFGVILILGSIAAGVYLVQRQQQLSQRAASGKECSHSENCILFDEPGNSGTREVPRVIIYAYITAKDYFKFEPGDTNNGCYHVIIDGRTITWSKIGSGPDCKDVSNVQVWMGEFEPSPTPQPTVSPTPTQGPQPTPTTIVSPTTTHAPTPTQPQISAQCSEVKAYNTSWNPLSSDDLKNLEAGDKVRFTVSGTASSGNFDKARFTINGSLKPDVTTKKPSSEEFYYEYTIPSGENNFSVKGEIHHTSLGWI